MPDVFYVDSSRCLTASLDTPPTSKGGLFALRPFASIADIIEAAEECYPLKWHIESVHYDIWSSMAEFVTDICGQDITTKQEFADLKDFGEPKDFEKLAELVLLDELIVSSFNGWLASEPDGEDWEHGDETVDGYRSAFVFFEENRDIAETLGIKIVEGRRPGDNTQVAELRILISEANTKAQAAGLDIIMQDIE